MLRVSVSTQSASGVPRAVTRGVRAGMVDYARVGYDVSQEEVAVDTGDLRESGIEPTWDGDVLVWGYRSDHARPIEEGTEPHYPPIDALRGWARRVLGDESAAWAVQQKIGEEGTDAQPYVEPGFRAMVREVRDYGFAAYIDREL